MAFQVLPILRTLAPLVVDAGRIAVGLRTSGSAAKVDDRVSRLEQETIRAGHVIRGIAEQLQAVAQELRIQAEATEVLQRRARQLMILSSAALCVAIGAVVVSLVH